MKLLTEIRVYFVISITFPVTPCAHQKRIFRPGLGISRYLDGT